MKAILAFLFHLVIALLAAPMLALLGGAAFVYPLIRYTGISSASPQQFFSEHLFLFLALASMWLGYQVCDTFTSRLAVWVWVPAILLLAIRIAIWRASESVLAHASVVEHFFTASCQLQNFQNANFAESCADKLLLMQLVIAPVGYSVGAAIYHVLKTKRRDQSTVSP